MQGGRKVRRKAHNLEIGGSNPLPVRKKYSCKDKKYILPLMYERWLCCYVPEWD